MLPEKRRSVPEWRQDEMRPHLRDTVDAVQDPTNFPQDSGGHRGKARRIKLSAEVRRESSCVADYLAATVTYWMPSHLRDTRVSLPSGKKPRNCRRLPIPRLSFGFLLFLFYRCVFISWVG